MKPVEAAAPEPSEQLLRTLYEVRSESSVAVAMIRGPGRAGIAESLMGLWQSGAAAICINPCARAEKACANTRNRHKHVETDVKQTCDLA